MPRLLSTRGLRIGMTAAIVLIAAGPTGSPAADERLGRLFFTPERRDALDRQRLLSAAQQQVPVVVEGSTLSVDGVVLRSSGRSTVWINGAPQQEGSLAPELRGTPRPGDPSRVAVNAGENTTRTLSVGQSVSRTTGEVADPLAGGRIVVNRGAPPGEKKAR